MRARARSRPGALGLGWILLLLLPWGGGSGSGGRCRGSFRSSELAVDEGLEDAPPLGGLGVLGLDVGVGEPGGGNDEGGAGEEEAGGGGALRAGGRVLQPNHDGPRRRRQWGMEERRCWLRPPSRAGGRQAGHGPRSEKASKLGSATAGKIGPKAPNLPPIRLPQPAYQQPPPLVFAFALIQLTCGAAPTVVLLYFLLCTKTLSNIYIRLITT